MSITKDWYKLFEDLRGLKSHEYIEGKIRIELTDKLITVVNKKPDSMG